jgi:hypothetical protein
VGFINAKLASEIGRVNEPLDVLSVVETLAIVVILSLAPWALINNGIVSK